MREGVGQVIGSESQQGVFGGLNDLAPVSGAEAANQLLEFGEDIFDRVQVGRVRRQVNQFGPDGFDRGCRCGGPMAPQIVEHHEIARLQTRREDLFAEAGKAESVDWTVENHRGPRPIEADGMHQRVGLPVTAGNRVDQPLAPGGPASKPGHVRLQACFIDEHEPLGIDVVLAALPIRAPLGDVGAVLFRGA